MEGDEGAELISECESGWTMYLSQSNCDDRSLDLFDQKGGFSYEGSGEQKEDMSMVSDATWPPLVDGDDGFYKGKTEFETMRSPRKEKEKEKCLQWMDDTASSHVYSFSKSNKQNMKWESIPSFSNKEETVENILEFSMDFSSTISWSKSPRASKYSLFKKTLPGTGATTNPICREENKNKIW